jgi:hypothetical protein
MNIKYKTYHKIYNRYPDPYIRIYGADYRISKNVKKIFDIPARIFDFTTPNIEYSFYGHFLYSKFGHLYSPEY